MLRYSCYYRIDTAGVGRNGQFLFESLASHGLQRISDGLICPPRILSFVGDIGTSLTKTVSKLLFARYLHERSPQSSSASDWRYPKTLLSMSLLEYSSPALQSGSPVH